MPIFIVKKLRIKCEIIEEKEVEADEIMYHSGNKNIMLMKDGKWISSYPMDLTIIERKP